MYKKDYVSYNVNVKAQKDEPGRYKIINHAIFYVCRLIPYVKQR